MADVADRVQSILDEMKISARELSRRAELKSESHVGLIVKRTVTRVSAEVLHAIAKAGNVEPKWLESGEGPRRRGEPIVVREERYDAMPAVRLMAQTDGMPADFIATFEAQLDLDHQPSADDLWTICKGEYAKWRGKRVPAGGDPLADLDQPRVRPARKKT